MQIRLRTKLVIFGLVFAVFPLGAAMFPSIVRFQHVQQQAVLERETQIAGAAAQEIAHFIFAQFQHAQEVAFFHPEFAKEERLRNLLMEKLLFKNDSFVDLSLLDSEGHEIVRKHRYRVVRESDLRDLSVSEAFQAAQKHRAYLSDVYFDQGRPLFTIGIGMYNARNEFQGAVLAEVDARIMQQVVSSITRDQGNGKVYIVNTDGIVRAHPDISEVLAQSDFSFLPIVASLKEDPPSAFKGTYRNETNEEVLGSWTPIVVRLDDITETPWHVIAEENSSFAFRHVREVVWFSFGALVFAGVLAALSALFVSRRIVMPIEAIHRLVMRIGEGDFSQRVVVRTNDETGSLARAFNAMAERIEEGKERDKEISKMKSEFLSIAAHQLRTPLSALKWVLYMVIEGDTGPLKKPQKELLKKGYEANERMVALVNDLLDVVRIEEGRFDYRFEKSSVEVIIQSIIKEIKVVADQKGVQLSLLKSTRRLPEVVVDPVKFRLAIANIIDNAVQYTMAGGQVDVELALKGNEILISVRDTGVGIPREQLSRVFTKFFRAGNAVRMQTVGSGLGLFIAKNIIEKHGGKIWIESIEGKGTTVYFTIPVSRK